MLKTFLEMSNDNSDTAVFSYGRHQPLTIGHEKLFDKTMEVAKEHKTKAHIYTSHSQDSKKNPLTAEHKVALIKHAYPDAHVSSSSKEIPSMLHIAKKLHDEGHKHLVMVAGSDRADDYHEKLHQYNGTHEKALYNFKTIKVVSAGQRDPDAQGAAGMSGTKLRDHAVKGNKTLFKSGLMSKLPDTHKEEIYHSVRSALKVNEIYDPHLKVSKYQWGEIEGVNKMKSMTPGETLKKKKMAEQKIPYLFMSPAQRARLHEESMQLEFDGIQTSHLDMCPSAYKEFKKMIEMIRSGQHIGEVTGHEPQTPQTPDIQRMVQAGIAMKPTRLKHMQFKQYTDM